MNTDPIADMLTQIRNALAVKKPEVVLPYSRLKHDLAELLQKQGWLTNAEMQETQNRKFLHLSLKYHPNGHAAIGGLRRVSKPGQRIYAKFSEIPKLHMGIGATIISTSKGLMTDQEARREKVGGEVICQIW